MAIEVRKFRSRGNDCLHPFGASKQRGENRRTLEDNAPSPRLQQGRIADELERVAVALLGMNEDAAPLKVRAIPSGLREATLQVRDSTIAEQEEAMKKVRKRRLK